ncbi:hypothetical protein Tco_0381145 [Tanacetum coccineum]
MPPADSYSSVDMTTLNTRHTPIQKQPEVLLCLVGLSQNFFLGDDVYPTFLYDDDRDMNLFNLISAPNPTKVKTGIRPRAAYEVPLLTATANRVIDMKDTIRTSESSGAPSAMEKSPLDFINENPSLLITKKEGTEEQIQDGFLGEIPPVENPAVTKVILELDMGREVAAMRPLVNKRRHKRGNDEADANTPPKVLRKNHAAYRPTHSTLEGKSLTSIGLEAGSTFSSLASQKTPADVSDPDPLSYAKPQPIPKQDIAQSSKGAATAGDLNSKKSSSFTSMVGSSGSIYQPRWGVTNNYRLDTPDGLLNQTRNLETLLKAEAQVTSEERIKAAFEEFKKYEDDRVNFRCAEMDARLDALSIDFDEELYPHMLTAIAGR